MAPAQGKGVVVVVMVVTLVMGVEAIRIVIGILNSRSWHGHRFP